MNKKVKEGKKEDEMTSAEQCRMDLNNVEWT